MMQIIGIDIGSLSTKGYLVDMAGRIVCRAAISHDIQHPNPNWVEQDAESVWWAETCEVIRRLLDDPAADRAAIAGVGVSGFFPAVALADEHAELLRPAMLYSDNRAADELADMNARFDLSATGDAVPPKLAWLRDHEPDVFRKARYVFSSHNYVGFRLTGEYYLDYKVADSLGGLLDHVSLEWRQDVAEWAGWEVSRLPRLCPEIEIVGEVTAQAAEATGLKAGTPVIAGSGDSPCTIVSAGVIEQGDALLSFGTSGWMGVLPRRLTDYYHNPALLAEGSPYLLRAYLLALGSALQWFRNEFGAAMQAEAARTGQSFYQMMDAQAGRIAAGSDGLIVLPYFMGGRAVQTSLPERATISGLTLSHSAAHIYRGLLEAFGYVTRADLESLAQQGLSATRIVATGGGAASAIWRQIISDIVRLPVHYYPNADPRLGSAYLTAYALGLQDSLEGIRDWLPPAQICEPSESSAARYDEMFRRFLDLQRTLAHHERMRS